jgi:hypothetical protein
MKTNSKLMAVSGIAGFVFFLIANFTTIFNGSAVLAGILQLVVNFFVFITWGKGFSQSCGFKKFVASFGVIVPIVMAGITIWRVLLPWIVAISR